MIDTFNADDDLHQPRIVLVNMLDQFGLGTGRAGDYNFAGVGDRLCNGVQKFFIGAGMTAADRIGLVVDMLGRMIGMQDEFVDIARAEMEDARFPVVDPDDGVKVMLAHGHIPSMTVGAP
jgi:hypothetical protein